jgi:PAS domain S-box-containing protein
MNGLDYPVGEMTERYKAYEHSAEALWRFELKKPVSASASPDEIIAHCRKHAYMAECNDNLAQMYGYEKSEEMIGAGMNDLMDLNEPVWLEYMRTFITNGFRSAKIETKEQDRYGNTVYFLNSMEGVVENGMLKRVWGTQQDITEKRNATDQLNYLARLINTVSDVIISQDKKFNVISWNKAAEIAYGYSAAEMIGRPVKEFLHFEYEGISRPRFFEMLNENGEWHGEAYVVNRHGRPITLLASITRIQNAKGETTGYVSVSKDITDKRKMEERLQQSELFYRSLFANSLDGVLITDDRGIIRFASSSITPILGYSETEVLEKSIFNYTHLEDRSLAITAFMDELSGNLKEKFISLRLLKKTGEWIWCFIRGHNLVQNPYIKGVVIYFHDDTLRRQTEAALIESEQRFRHQATVLNNVTDIILTTDTQGIVTSCNKVLEKLSGITEAEAKGKLVGEIFPADHSPYSINQVAAIILKEGVWRGEVSFKRQDGQIISLLYTISMLHNDKGHFIGFLGVGKDITERKKAETRLQESEQFYRDMSYYSFDGIAMSDEKGKIVYCGPSIQRISGYEPSQLLGHNLFEFIHPEDVPAARDGFFKELNKQSEVNYLSLRLKLLNKKWLWCTVRTHNLMDTPGFNAMVIYFTNDSKRKEAEDRLRESEEKFRNLIYNLKQGVMVQYTDGVITICNQAALEMFGMASEELLGKSILDMTCDVIREDGTVFPEQDYPFSIVLQTKKSVRDIVMGVYRKASNDRAWLLANSEPILDEDGEIISIMTSLADITEQKRLTRELFEQEVQKQKLLVQATIDGQEKERQLMGKELHDNINQHLTTTRLYLEVAREKATGEALEMIHLSHKTLAGIIHEIRQLSQSLVPPTLGDIGLTESIQELCDSLKRAHAFNIDFYHPYFNEEDMPANLKLMLYRITQEQVNNIVRHAHAANLHIKLQSDAEYIFLTISDDGIGFDPAHYKKGMGFSNIVTRADLFNGKVEIDTAPGKGCQLSIIIPLETTGEVPNI